ncbi:Lrp/AsnC family transcriptional regulator [Haladaptatus sp. CMSO5]|uniref:Lrp/AsnC family transcriptional regulator n=1 Tax=Haladaptatus sp. CMSO5 TaxID=3120514 RepID=UPI002FCE30F8
MSDANTPPHIDTIDSDSASPQSVLKNVLDTHDYEIFRALNEDGRMSDTDLAERVGLSRTAVRRRRENLESDDVLEVLAVIVLQAADLAYGDVLIQFDHTVPATERKQFVRKVLDEGLIYRVDSCIGEHDLLISTWNETLNDVKEYVWDLFEDESVVKEYTIIPIVKTWKAWDKELDRP